MSEGGYLNNLIIETNCIIMINRPFFLNTEDQV